MRTFIAQFVTANNAPACRKLTALSLKEAISQWVRTQDPTHTLTSIQQAN